MASNSQIDSHCIIITIVIIIIIMINTIIIIITIISMTVHVHPNILKVLEALSNSLAKQSAL